MKVSLYELLGMIKDNKAPKKIKGRLNKVFIYDDYFTDYVDENGGLLFYHLMIYRDKCLNDEVEIIEEDKKIEKIDFRTLNTQKEKNRVMKDTINEIIDKLEEMEENK